MTSSEPKRDFFVELLDSLKAADGKISEYLSRDENYYMKAANPENADPNEFDSSDKDPKIKLMDKDLTATQTTIFYLLAAIKNFLGTTIPEANTRPLDLLMREIHSIGMGNPPKLLRRPFELKKGSVHSRDNTYGMVLVVCAVMLLARVGDTQKAAIDTVAKKVGLSPGNLKSWVKKFNRGDNLPVESVTLYKKLLKKMYSDIEQTTDSNNKNIHLVQGYLEFLISQRLNIEKGI